MIKLVIFGTGSSGERAWQAANSLDGVEIVAFADNDARKHGTKHHGVAVVAPASLSTLTWDLIVLASQWAAEIAAQLTGLGIPANRIVQPSLNDLRPGLQAAVAEHRTRSLVRIAGGREIPPDTLPRVLILTYETLNDSHGTGVLLRRYFRDFPESHLFSLVHTETGKPSLKNHAVLADVARQTPEAVATLLRERGFVPDIVYATVFNEIDLPLLNAVIDALPAGTPVVQHFMDYMPHNAEAFDATFRGVLPRVTQVWALTKPLRDMLAAKFQRSVELVSSLQQTPPAEWRREHRAAGAGFRTVLLGNLWQPWLVPLLRDAWQRCRAQLPGLGPIEWYVHPQRVQSVMDAGYDPGLEIVWRGFVTGPALQEKLRTADLALVPFNFEAKASNDYARYSLPSRLTELCGAGLPLLAVASPDTEPARFFAAHGLGRVVAGPDVEAVAGALLAFIQDQSARSAAGRAARKLAETDFQLEAFQEWLVGRFVDLTSGRSRAQAVAAPSSIVRLAGTENLERANLAELMRDRIHYACGRNVLAEWLNVDGFDESYPYGTVPPDYVKKIFRMDLTRPHPFPDNSFRLGYSEDFLEHLDQADSITFLAEAFRTLKPGGVLRLSFPGLKGILKRHLRGNDHAAGARCRDEAYTRWWHKHFFSFEELADVSRHIGYSAIRQCEYGKSTIPELQQETRPNQAELNLVVELVK